MSLTSGTRLGPYEILAPIGAGGMGEVYRAKDTRLGREVALKVISERLGADSNVLARFEREAKAVAALSHPNILAIFDFGQEGAINYAVMELLEGETLGEKLSKGALPAFKAQDLAAKVAQGLAAAHEKGIVHRDLKPANIFLTKGGHVKILDFGLARILEPEGLRSDLDQGSTGVMGTGPGMILGTVGYMSPEQARGEAAGPASDIFSLGCVLYEMIAGHKAFQGDSAVAILHAILTKDPLKERADIGVASQGLAKILEICLEKNPDDRFHSAHDLALALETATLSASGPMVPLQGKRQAPAAAAIVLGSAILLGAVGTAAWYLGRRGAPSRSPTFETITFRRGTVLSARFTPDGRSVVYTASWEEEPARMFIKRPESEDAVPMGPARTQVLAISKQGELAVQLDSYMSGPFCTSGILALMSLAGDAPRPYEAEVATADWSPTGQGLALVKDLGDHHRLEFPRGKTLYETKGYLSDLRFSPDGTELAFLDHPHREDARGYPVRVAAASGKLKWPDARASSAETSGLAWSADGREVLIGLGRELLAIDRRGRRRMVTRLPQNVAVYDSLRDGRLLLGQESKTVGMAGIDEAGQRDLSWLSWSLVMDLTPDGRQVVFTEFGTSKGAVGLAALRGFDGSPVVRLGEGWATGASPDGRWVAAARLDLGKLLLLPTGLGEARELPTYGISNRMHARFFPDGKSIAFYGYREGTGASIFVQGLDGGEPRAIGGMGARFGLLAISPSGDKVIATGPDRRPWIFPLTGTAVPLPGGKEGQMPIRWSEDGRAVFLHSMGEVPVSLRKVDVATGREEIVRQICPADRSGLKWVSPIAMTADARRIAFSYQRVLSQAYIVGGLH